MSITLPETEKVREETVRWVGARPITFDEFLEMFGHKDYVELVGGSVAEKAMVQLEHEKLYGWLYILLGLLVKSRGLGMVLGSRTAVRINDFGGRLPDLLFVRHDRLDIVQEKAVCGAPDLVIEIISPGDQRSDLIALETDYRTLGVNEILFIDPRRRLVRCIRREAGDYAEEMVKAGAVQLESLGGIRLETGWLFDEPRPDERELLARFTES